MKKSNMERKKKKQNITISFEMISNMEHKEKKWDRKNNMN